MHGRLGSDGDRGRPERRRVALPGGLNDPGARVRQRPRAFAGVDLERIRRVHAVPRNGPTADRTAVFMFPRLAAYSQIVARLQWDPAAIDLTADARAWPGLPEARRRRLTTLLAGFRVAEDAVAQHLVPFADVAENVD